MRDSLRYLDPIMSANACAVSLGATSRSALCWPRTVFPGSRNVPNVPDVPNVPNVPNNVPNIPGHGGQDGLLAEGYVAKISMLISATYPVAALDGTVRNQNQN